MLATFDGRDGDPFNSPRYRQARAVFSTVGRHPAGASFCERCPWDQETVTIGGPKIRRYFRAADPWFFDRPTLRILSQW